MEISTGTVQKNQPECTVEPDATSVAEPES
jgi:hypothetical protein